MLRKMLIKKDNEFVDGKYLLELYDKIKDLIISEQEQRRHMYQKLEIIPDHGCEESKVLRVKGKDLIPLYSYLPPHIVVGGELKGFAFSVPYIPSSAEWKLVEKDGELYLIAINK